MDQQYFFNKKYKRLHSLVFFDDNYQNDLEASFVPKLKSGWFNLIHIMTKQRLQINFSVMDFGLCINF